MLVRKNVHQKSNSQQKWNIICKSLEMICLALVILLILSFIYDFTYFQANQSHWFVFFVQKQVNRKRIEQVASKLNLIIEIKPMNGTSTTDDLFIRQSDGFCCFDWMNMVCIVFFCSSYYLFIWWPLTNQSNEIYFRTTD